MVFSKEDKILIKFTRTEGLRFYPFSYRIEAPSARVEQVTFLSFREKRVWKFVIIAKFRIKLYVYYCFFVILLI